MRKSTGALVGLVAKDTLLLAGALWLVLQAKRGGQAIVVTPGESITTITATAGAAIGVVTAIFLMAFIVHRRRGN